MKTLNIIVIVLVVIMILGTIINRRKNSCTPRIIIDTVYSKTLIHDTLVVHSPPHQIVKYEKYYVIKEVPGKGTVDTVFLDNDIGFTSIDTIMRESIGVIVSDTGNCYGILRRGTKFIGSIPTQTITKTITVTEKPKPFEFWAGINGVFSPKYDLGPEVSLKLWGKYSVGYSYLLGNNTNNIHLTTKIK